MRDATDRKLDAEFGIGSEHPPKELPTELASTPNASVLKELKRAKQARHLDLQSKRGEFTPESWAAVMQAVRVGSRDEIRRNRAWRQKSARI
jgi:hypothetical protein